MLQENIIEVKNITKRFRVYKDKGNSLKERVLFHERSQYESRTVLNNISFSIKKGEAVGLIGQNGCGKSTTLKLLTKIMYPDTGTIEIKGRVSSLLELGAGFHPDMSGRDNIYINASIFGLTRKEIDEKLERIIEFSELEEYIDNPVRTYSSGMYMRLAFSVAINVNADVLLIDEILAVGDANFQKKCLEKMRQIKNQGTTIVLVSHSLQQIESICDRSIWIKDGEIEEDGFPYPVHMAYLRYMSGQFKSIESKTELVDNSNKEVRPDISIKSVELFDVKEKRQDIYELGQSMRVSVKLEVRKPTYINVKLAIIRKDGVRCYATQYDQELGELLYIENNGEIAVYFKNILLVTNDYKVGVTIEDSECKELDYNDSAEFQVKSNTEERGVFRMEHVWE